MAPAKTGRESNNKKTVTRTDQIKRLMCSKETAILRKFLTVHIKLIAPKMELTPAQ